MHVNDSNFLGGQQDIDAFGGMQVSHSLGQVVHCPSATIQLRILPVDVNLSLPRSHN
jgi:hypothetical protein